MANEMAKDLVAVEQRALTAAQFGELAAVPPELEWLANITNPHTRRAYGVSGASLKKRIASGRIDGESHPGIAAKDTACVARTWTCPRRRALSPNRA
jgi:hypothetical protein